MAAALDPRKAIKEIPVPLFVQLLEQFKLRRAELVMLGTSDSKVDVYETVMRAEPEIKRSLLGVLRQAFDIADDAGGRVMAQELVQAHAEIIQEFQSLPSHIARAIWFYVTRRSDFERIAHFAAADRLYGGRSWKAFQGLPARVALLDDQFLAGLRKGVSGYYQQAERRGGQCDIVPYVRGETRDYFFVYMDDHPQSMMVFRDDQEQPTTISERIAYENIFVHDRQEKVLHIYAPGGRKVLETLADKFCMAAFGRRVPLTLANTRVYKLDHLVDPSFTLAVNPSIGLINARIRSIKLREGYQSDTLQYDAGPKFVPDMVPRILRRMRAGGIVSNSTRVASVTFEVGLKCLRTGRSRVMSFYVTWPGSCALLSKPDEDREIGEWCLKAWGISQ